MVGHAWPGPRGRGDGVPVEELRASLYFLGACAIDEARRRAVVLFVADGVCASALMIENDAADALMVNVQFDCKVLVAVGVAGVVAVLIGNVDE